MTKKEQVEMMTWDIISKIAENKRELKKYMTEENMDLLVSDDGLDFLSELDDINGYFQYLFKRLDDKFGKAVKYQHKGDYKNKWVYKGLSRKVEESTNDLDS